MNAQRLTINNILRNGHRYATFHQASVQAQTEPYNDEQNESGRFTDTVIPLVNLLSHRSDTALFPGTFIPSAWPFSNVKTDNDPSLKHRYYDIFKNTLNATLPKEKKTAEKSVQTDLIGGMHDPKGHKEYQLEFESQIAVELMKTGFHEEAIKHFLHASENGHVDAMNHLADCLYHGRGAKENKREAWRLWKEAASIGHVEAMYRLAACYIGGEGTKVNEEEGIKWMWIAANSGNPDASFYLILKLIHEGHPDRARRLIKHAICDSEYHDELQSWVCDKVFDEASLLIIREELNNCD